VKAGGDNGRSGPPLLLRWLHRIGYLTTGLVVLLALWAAYIALEFPLPGHKQDWDGNLVQQELEKASERFTRSGGDAVLAALPSRSEMAGSELRIVVMPSFSDWFGVGLYRRSDGTAAGILSRHQQPSWNPDDPLKPVEIGRYSFQISAEEYHRFHSWFDRWLRKYGRDNGRYACLDGTPIAFERVQGSKIVSGMGNCERHYELIKQYTLAFVKRHVPQAPLPADANWHEYAEQPSDGEMQ